MTDKNQTLDIAMPPSSAVQPALPTPPTTIARPSFRHRVRKRWGCVVVAATFALFVVLYGILFSYNVYFVAFQKEFGSSATLTAWVGSIPLSISLMLAPLITLASERFGYRSVSVVGILLASAGIFVTPFLPSLIPMFGTYGFMAAVGTGIVTVCAFDLIVMYFPEKNTTRVVSIVTTGSTTGMLSFSQIQALLISWYGWRFTMMIMGGLLFTVGVPCVLSFILPRNHHGNKKNDKKGHCKVISAHDGLVVESPVKTINVNENGVEESLPMLDETGNGALTSGYIQGYKVIGGLEEDERSIVDDDQYGGGTTTIDRSSDDCSVLSDNGSENVVVDDKEVRGNDDDDSRNLQVSEKTVICDVSLEEPWTKDNNVAKKCGRFSSRGCVVSDQSNSTSRGDDFSTLTTPTHCHSNYKKLHWTGDKDIREMNCSKDIPFKRAVYDGSTLSKPIYCHNNSSADQSQYPSCSHDKITFSTPSQIHRSSYKEIPDTEEVDTLIINSKIPVERSDPGMLRKVLRALAMPELWLICIAFALNGFGDLFYYANAISYLISIGFPEHIGVQFLSFIALAILVTKVLLIFIGEYIPFPKVIIQAICNFLCVGVWISLMVVKSVIHVYCTAIAAGFTMAITNVMVFSICPDFFGPERALETASVLYMFYGTGFLLGSLMGQSIDNTGSYASALWAFLGMYPAGGIMLLLAPLYQRIFAPERFVTFELHCRKREARRERRRLKKSKGSRCRSSTGEFVVCEMVTSV